MNRQRSRLGFVAKSPVAESAIRGLCEVGLPSGVGAPLRGADSQVSCLRGSGNLPLCLEASLLSLNYASCYLSVGRADPFPLIIAPSGCLGVTVQ